MESEIIGAYIGAAASLIVGAAAVISAGIANGRAKDANDDAKRANELAARALAQADKANDIAEHANALSEEANEIIRRQAAQQSDPAHIDWTVEWEKDSASLIVTNTGRDTAYDVSVLIQGAEVDELIKRENPEPRNASFQVPLPQIAERRAKREAERLRDYESARASGIVIIGSQFSVKLAVDIRWATEFGKPGVERFELKAR